ncbi:hypothetical protein A3C86_03800 [Candidatus Kaiserbacteria bacterium RIFCSPHIGHO2_02_FULL_49_16]|uniref:Uncharacterized protein n=1 Tax=Candidatus Kaiserbacteria bacterium RIFCSPHIGHO2_02_FULL_49_16 TaxID=1798490 RepID=A0A1F6D9X5_9BACT|nr:MAG: hypothetical protein A3C86_03800 [Candidatus Kaiserbacteria bacterium RIFCSPHIGHO2_02_FULL_49_16]
MGKDEINQEIQIILEEAKNINISSQEDIIHYVRVAVSASTRLLTHVSNLAYATVLHRNSLNELNQSVQNLTKTTTLLTQNVDSVAQSSQKLLTDGGRVHEKATVGVKLGIVALLVIGVLVIAYLWPLFPEQYRWTAGFLILGAILVPVAKLAWKHWNS